MNKSCNNCFHYEACHLADAEGHIPGEDYDVGETCPQYVNEEAIAFKSDTDALIIGYDHNPGKDNTVLIVGRVGQAAEIINAFEGKEAEELYLKLTTKKESKA